MSSSLKAALILVLVFAVGGLAGFLASKQFGGRLGGPVGPGLDPFRLQRGVIEHIEGRLVNAYDLTEEQRLGVQEILIGSQKTYETLYRETRPTLDQIRRTQQAAIRELMSDEQREKFDKWMEERRSRREAREGRGERGNRGGPDGTRGPRGPRPPSEEESDN